MLELLVNEYNYYVMVKGMLCMWKLAFLKYNHILTGL